MVPRVKFNVIIGYFAKADFVLEEVAVFGVGCSRRTALSVESQFK
jgi:hypothetical protein